MCVLRPVCKAKTRLQTKTIKIVIQFFHLSRFILNPYPIQLSLFRFRYSYAVLLYKCTLYKITMHDAVYMRA